MHVRQKFAVISLAITVLHTPMTQAHEWSYQLEPYVFFSSINGDASLGRVTGAEVEVEFDDILETLDSALMLHFEGIQNDQWGFLLDYGFMDLRDDISTSRDGVVSTRTRQGVLEAGAFYRTQLNEGTLDYFSTVRWWDMDLEVAIDPTILPGSVARERDVDWVDLVVGMRWETPVSDNWIFSTRVDVGGFGIGSDFTSVILTGVKYAINERFTFDLAYKATWVDYETGSRGQPSHFEYDTLTHGPNMGLIYHF